MPPIRSSASKRCTRIVAVILSLSKIMPTYSRCVLKGLVYIAILKLVYGEHEPLIYKINIYRGKEEDE